MRSSLKCAAVILCLLLALPAAAGDWPAFRGPTGDGDAGSANLPLTWSESENVTWKTPIPFKGWSTPVILAGQIWLTTATEEGNDFFGICVDAKSGEIVFNEKLFHCDEPEPLGNNVNCYASPSPVIEPGRVYLHFGSYGTTCIDTATKKVLWKRDDLPCRHYRGPGSSPFLFENLLILSMDGVDVQYMVALDKLTGETVWKTDRSTVWHDYDPDGTPNRDGDARKAFSTPRIIDVDGEQQLFSLAAFAAYAYNPRTGRELWHITHSGHTSSASPLFHKGLAYVLTGHVFTEIWAVRAGGQGDVSDSRVVWKFGEKKVPTTPSPIIVDDRLYMISNNGQVTCLKPDTGEELWSERVGGGYIASPIHAAGHLYFCSSQGKTVVLKAGPAYAPLAENSLDDGCMASPAVSGDALFLRTTTHLYRIENANAK